MAQRLRARGESVGHLFFMDATTPYGRNDPDLTFEDVMNIFANDLESIERTYEVRANPKRREKRSMSLAEFIKAAQRMGVAPPEYSEDEARRKIAVYINNVRLFRKWRAPHSDLDIILFKATKQRTRLPYRWRRHTTGAMSVIRIPCNHVRIGFEPFVNQVATHVNAYLRNEPIAQAWWRRALAAITRKSGERRRLVEPA